MCQIVFSTVLLAVFALGCTRHQPEPATEHPHARQQRLNEAIAYIQDAYPGTTAIVIDDKISVIWETGAESKFKALREHVENEFGVTVTIGAIE